MLATVQDLLDMLPGIDPGTAQSLLNRAAKIVLIDGVAMGHRDFALLQTYKAAAMAAATSVTGAGPSGPVKRKSVGGVSVEYALGESGGSAGASSSSWQGEYTHLLEIVRVRTGVVGPCD